MNKIVHTDANNQSGGLNTGFFIVWYHVLMDMEVNNEPNTPTIKGIVIEIANLIPLNLLSYYNDFINNIRIVKSL